MHERPRQTNQLRILWVVTTFAFIVSLTCTQCAVSRKIQYNVLRFCRVKCNNKFLPQTKPVIQPYDLIIIMGVAYIFPCRFFSSSSFTPNYKWTEPNTKKKASTNTCYRSFLYIFSIPNQLFPCFTEINLHHRWLSGFFFLLFVCCYFVVFI